MKIQQLTPASQNGQTLIEVLAALTAAVIIIAAITSASINALNNSQFSRDQNIASQYTQAGVEIIRDMRNQSIASLSATYLPDGTYCMADGCTALTSTQTGCWQPVGTDCTQNIGKFVREVQVSRNLVDCNATPTPTGTPTSVFSTNVKIVVITSWNDARCTNAQKPYCHSATQSTCLSDFTVLPTP